MTKSIRVSLAAATLILGAAGVASADAWSSAKGRLAADASIVVGVDVAALRGSSLFKQLTGMAMSEAREMDQAIGVVKSACGVDPLEAVQSVAVVLGSDGEKGAIFVQAKGVDSRFAADCLNKIGAATSKKKITITAGAPDAKGIVEYVASGEKDKLYVAWLDGGVFAIATDPFKKDMLEKAIGGAGIDAGSPAGKSLALVNTGAAIWGVVIKREKLDRDAHMTHAFGHATLTGGKVGAEVHLGLASAKEADGLAKKANTQLAEVKKDKDVPPAVKTALDGVTVKAAGAELTVNASLPEKDFLNLVSAAFER